MRSEHRIMPHRYRRPACVIDPLAERLELSPFTSSTSWSTRRPDDERVDRSQLFVGLDSHASTPRSLRIERQRRRLERQDTDAGRSPTRSASWFRASPSRDPSSRHRDRSTPSPRSGVLVGGGSDNGVPTGSSDLKMPEPTNTACAPNCMTRTCRRAWRATGAEHGTGELAGLGDLLIAAAHAAASPTRTARQHQPG